METILGIDLGTTNSAVSIIRDGKVEVLEEEGQKILPSVVGLDGQGKLLVGFPAQNQWVLAPQRTVRSIKRKMGSAETVSLGDQSRTPQEISAIILRELKQRAARRLGYEVRKAVITVPAFFNEQQREATREAGELAGLEVVRIINEPTAASLTYNPNQSGIERLLVYDLGGGTFDVSIVQIEEGVIEVLSSHGDTQLGGDDFDQLLLDLVCNRFLADHGVDLRETPATRARVLRAVEAAKRRLSTEAFTAVEEEFITDKDGVPLHLRLEISRSEYEDLIESLLNKTLVCVDEALADAKLNAQQIDRVILVGGASRTPMVHRLLSEQLDKPIHQEVDPDLAVSMGAAIQGGLIGGIEIGPVLVDITPHTLGIRCISWSNGYPSPFHFAPLIQRNSALPATASDLFATFVDGQESATIRIYQGESDDVHNNDLVGEFTLDGLSGADAGNQILVRFDLDLDGILTATAVERATGRSQRLSIDNAVSRFRRSNHQQAARRIDEAFGDASPESPGSDVQPGAGRGGVAPVAASQPAADGTSDARIPAAAVSGTGLSAGGAAMSLDQWPAELRKVVEAATELLDKRPGSPDSASDEDKAEIRRLLEQLKNALAAGDQEAIRMGSAKLDDLIFYLADA